MAVAPIDQVRRVLEYGLSQIPRSKILMGIPNYGYDWTLPYVQGKSQAENISNPQAVARAARYGASIQFDQVAQSPLLQLYGRPGESACGLVRGCKKHEIQAESG